MKKKVQRIARGVFLHVAEHKFKDVTQVNDAALTNAANVLITPTLMAKGNGVGERIGRQIKCASLHVKGFFWQNYNPTNKLPCLVRCIVFRSIGEDFGTAPTAADFMANATAGNTAILSPQSIETKAAYKILADRLYQLDPIEAQTRKFKFRVNLGGGQCEYIADTAAQADATAGHYYVMFLTNLNDAGATPCNAKLNYWVRLYYTDA